MAHRSRSRATGVVSAVDDAAGAWHIDCTVGPPGGPHALVLAMDRIIPVGVVIKAAMDNGYEVIDADYSSGSAQHGPLPLPGGGGAVPGGGGAGGGGSGELGGSQKHVLGFKLRKRPGR